MATNASSDTPVKTISIQRFQIGLNVLIQLLVFGGIVIMLNYLSFRHFKRWDFSRDHKYALSSQTKSLLGSLKKPVKTVIFFSGAAEIAPDIGALLREYEFASHGMFTTEVVDPYRNITRATELATKYKIRENDNIVILDYDGRNKFVNASEMADFEQPDQLSVMMGQAQPKLKAFKGEQAITSALLELTEGKPNKVYYVTSHGEPDLNGQDLKVFNDFLKRQNIQVSPLNLLNVNSVPEDARAVIICGPKYDLSELEIKLIHDFWESRKGRLFILLNPYAKTLRLADWLITQGITPQEDRLIRTGAFIAIDQAAGTQQVKTGTISQAAFVIHDSGTSITSKDLVGVSKQLLGATESLLLDQTKETTAKMKFFPLLESGEGFWGETDPTDTAERPAYFDPKKDHIGPLNIAVAAEKGGVADRRVKVDTSRLVVVGNAELLGNNAYRLSEGINIDFAVNALNWLLDREQLIGIPPKEKKSVALSLDETQLRNLAIVLMVGVPGFVALLGVLNWWQRRA